MPPPSHHRADIEPPAELTTEAAKGFMTGVFRVPTSKFLLTFDVQFGSVSILAHMIMILPHPFTFSAPTPPTTAAAESQPRPRPSAFSREYLRSRLFYRPLEGFSEWISPTSRVYRGLTPQFKVFLQIAVMTLGGCIWAERRVTEYIEIVRRIKRAERLQAERAQGSRP
ncbi:uncharacterized protein N7482_005124 [Penicillium canariense]|uniref:Uncharacterized protein n=1 Tax=Penicillium canariense TaxID=189055 RepID=A0A9W9LN50_9EURO|nr:uncharacterized protein N7482_005124 [Penicillium canariense]KAJ5166343.1 hypothetical protein N7482_005124 [Penicillium canariense]